MTADDEVRQFCHHMRPRLVGSLSLLLGRADVAEELAQETLARVWVHWKAVRQLGQPGASAWTYRVAMNLGKSWIRRRRAERRATDRLSCRADAIHNDPDQADALAVRQAIAALPRRQRTALVLRYYADLPVAHTAELMRCSPNTVKSLTSQAVAGLRAKLKSPTPTEVVNGR